jgi:hypothetical protein
MRAIERSWCIILKCPCLIGTAMIVVWTSTMSPIRKCVGAVGLNLLIHIWVNFNWHNIKQHTEVVFHLGAYNIARYCLLHEHKYCSALMTEFPWDLLLGRMKLAHYVDHHVVKWSSGCRSLSWNTWWNYQVGIRPKCVPETADWIAHGFDTGYWCMIGI